MADGTFRCRVAETNVAVTRRCRHVRLSKLSDGWDCKARKNRKNRKTYVSDRMLGPQTSPCQTRFFRFFEFVSFFLLGAFWWIDLMQSDGRVGK